MENLTEPKLLAGNHLRIQLVEILVEILKNQNCPLTTAGQHTKIQTMLYNMNLKQLLMEHGNRLVLGHGYDPATAATVTSDRSTWPIHDFTEWLNGCPEARLAVAELGVDWTVV